MSVVGNDVTGPEGASANTLLDVLIARLERSSLTDGQQLLVLAAFEGDEPLAQVMEGVVDARMRVQAVAEAEREQQKAFLGKVTVRGFRGIGPEAALQLQPGPGLTLILGRNGSGKSTFADGVEIAFTGTT
ncbi:MAG TPA: AAA family ATPase, partial [Jiangellaceae bacterium]